MNDIDVAVNLDRLDPLASYQDCFDLPKDVIYLDGNSLGALPSTVSRSLSDVIHQQWGEDLIKSWNRHGWIDLPITVGEKIAPLLGAAEGQVVCTDSTSVNLFKLIIAALEARPGRTEILSQRDNFPTDLYMAESATRLLGADRASLRIEVQEKLLDAIGEHTALLMLTHVNFRDGAVHDMKQLTAAAHQAGALVLWDLSHSAGVFELALDNDGVDFAVGCGYKYLNGGPGAPAYLYVNRRHHPSITQPLTGWMGHADPFAFHTSYSSDSGIRQFLTGTPGILGMQALSVALDLYADVDLAEVRQKSMALTDYFIELVTKIENLDVISPPRSDHRGSQVSIRHHAAYAISQALIERGVIGDFRDPDLLRFGFSPLYTSYRDVYRAVEVLADILSTGYYRAPVFSQRKSVT